MCNYGGFQYGGDSFAYQGNSGGDGAEWCAGGGGGAGEKGDNGSDSAQGFLDDCFGDKGGEGIYLGDIVGTDYGYPGGWFAGGGNPSGSLLNRTKGGGGSRATYLEPDTYSIKTGAENTGGGGMGCLGTLGSVPAPKEAILTCHIALIPNQGGVFDAWGGNGGSGILFIVFDLCPCSNN